jgi:hypothetical protein
MNLIKSDQWKFSMEFCIAMLIDSDRSVDYVITGSVKSKEELLQVYEYSQTQTCWEVYEIEWNLVKFKPKCDFIIIDNLFNWCCNLYEKNNSNLSISLQLVRYQLEQINLWNISSVIIFTGSNLVNAHFSKNGKHEELCGKHQLYLSVVELFDKGMGNANIFKVDNHGFVSYKYDY